jgi:ankyrin repeat protein
MKKLLLFALLALCALQPVQAMKSNDLDAPLNKQLVKATKEGDLQTVSLLIAAGASVNPQYIHTQIKPCKDQSSEICDCHPLIIAAEKGLTDICCLLIANKANVNTKNCWGRTALHQASWEGHEDIVSQLLKTKATITKLQGASISNVPISSLHLTAREVVLNQQLIKATAAANYAQAAQLIEEGANANPQYRHSHRQEAGSAHRNKEMCLCYPLVLAAKNGSSEICSLLIAHNANANAKDCWGQTALHKAAYAGYEEIVRQLLQARANVNEKNQNGENALNLAACGNNGAWRGIVQTLIDANVNLFQKGYNTQESALYWLAVYTTNNQGTIHPLCHLYVQKMLEAPNKSQSKRLITLLCCFNKKGGYKDLYKLFKAPLLAVVAEENSADPESKACQMIEEMSNSTQDLKEALLKKYIKAPKKSAPDKGICVLC